MNKKMTQLIVALSVFGITSVGKAQIVQYIGCVVDDVPSLTAAMSSFYDSMAGGARPTVSLDLEIWNGEDPATHTIIVEYPDYQALEAFRSRMAGSVAFLVLGNSFESVASCDTEGLAVEMGFWGDRDAEWEFAAVYPLMATDQGRYADAFAEFAESLIETAPGPIALYQNRAGVQNASNFVVFFASSLAGLNEFIDDILESDGYEEFIEEVTLIRTIGTASQIQRIRTWTP